MLTYLVVALQASAVSGPPLDVPRKLRATNACKPDAADPDAIVVCARRDEPYRLKPLPQRADDPAIPKAETTLLGKTRLAVEGEQAGVGGFVSNRAMVRLKIPF